MKKYNHGTYMRTQFICKKWYAITMFFFLFGVSQCVVQTTNEKDSVSEVLDRVQAHDFHPLNNGGSGTIDRTLGKSGIADLDDNDWKVRLLAVSDLVRLGIDNVNETVKGLSYNDEYVRQISAMALGILRAQDAIESLEEVVRNDSSSVVRSQAVIALGQIESKASLTLLEERLKEDPSRDVRHQCELAIDQIQKQKGTTIEQLTAFQNMDSTTFELLEVGKAAPDFELKDTESKIWKLSSFEKDKWVVLIWVFADWCPVCHGEFHDLMEMKDEFKKEGVQIFTLECHDLYRGRVMVGKELAPNHWFAKEPFNKVYTEKIFWPHLLDRAGAVGAMYGVDPMAFAVHSEFINRPSTVIVNPDGIVQFAYYGTYWGDRPTIEETLEMIRTGNFEFEHPKSLKLP